MAVVPTSLSVSGFTAKNENMANLMHNSIELSFLKIEQPREFQPVGNELSTARRHNAERGRLNMTARRLGALFEQKIPMTAAHIIKPVYGRRASKIVEEFKKKHPQGDPDDSGPFAEHIGVDASTIWAAATCGTPAFAAHLLACLLADAFDPATATAIWTEITDTRKKQIYAGLEDGQTSSVHAIMNEVTREDLEQWDAGARAWLQIADNVMAAEVKKFNSILDLMSLPVSFGETTYENILNACQLAMNAMANALNAQPQSATKAAALLGMRSWHIFPDMDVQLSNDEPILCPFNDDLVPQGGQMTVGLESNDPSHSGIKWSLPLAHYQYYGDAVVVSRNLCHDGRRLSIHEMKLLEFGSLLAVWRLTIDNVEQVAKIFVAMWDLLLESSQPQNSLSQVQQTLLSPDSWLGILVAVSKHILDSDSKEKEMESKLIALGIRRRGTFLLDESDQLRTVPLPLFGLVFKSIYSMLTDDSPPFNSVQEAQHIAALREIARVLKLQPHQSIIRVGKKHLQWAVKHDECKMLNTSQYSYSSLANHADRYPWKIDLACATKGRKALLYDFIKIGTGDGQGNTDGENIQTKFSKAQPQPCHCLIDPVGEPVFDVLAGEIDVAALYIKVGDPKLISSLKRQSTLGTKHKAAMSLKHLEERLNNKSIKPDRLLQYLVNFTKGSHTIVPHLEKPRGVFEHPSKNLVTSLQAVAAVCKLYQSLPNATIDGQIINKPIHKARWVQHNIGAIQSQFSLDHASAFACIAMMESGTHDLAPNLLQEVIALSFRNTIYASDTILKDPFDLSNLDRITMLYGNVGKSGLVMMFSPSPARLQIRPPMFENWKDITHAKIGSETDMSACLIGTSMHLSFYKTMDGLTGVDTGIIDREVSLIETVISVHDHGKWVADINPLSLYSSLAHVTRIDDQTQTCPHSTPQSKQPKLATAIALKSWNEIVDSPMELGYGSIGVIRTASSWVARLASACVSSQKSHTTALFSPVLKCWKCCLCQAKNFHIVKINETPGAQDPLHAGSKDVLLPSRLSSIPWRFVLEDDDKSTSAYSSDDDQTSVNEDMAFDNQEGSSEVLLPPRKLMTLIHTQIAIY